MRPVSGWKLRAGSSVVIRHWMAQPLRWILSCVRSRSFSVLPSAILIWACTRSTLYRINISHEDKIQIRHRINKHFSSGQTGNPDPLCAWPILLRWATWKFMHIHTAQINICHKDDKDIIQVYSAHNSTNILECPTLYQSPKCVHTHDIQLSNHHKRDH